MDNTSAANQEEIISQLIKLNIGSREEIIDAINDVINKNNINDIAEYILNKQQKNINTEINNSVKFITCIIYEKHD